MRACLSLVLFKNLAEFPMQNACHFPDDILKCIFLNENVYISIVI